MNAIFTTALFSIMLNTNALQPLPQPLDNAQQMSASEIRQAMNRLAVVGNVLYVAAHPDDENTSLLAYLANGRLLRAAYLSLTRGEGGQNLIGAEQSPWLGLIRTHELLAARSVDGAEQWFGRQRDFGFSKSPAEALSIWGKDESLADVVWAIRRFQPDVIVTGFDPNGKDTHGHHTASAQLALEAFTLAGNEKAFAEQLKWVKPWAAKRIVRNTWFRTPPKPEELKGLTSFDVNGYSPLLGLSHGELAAKSRSMHKSQGFGNSPERGPDLEYFSPLLGEPMTTSPFDGLDFTWGRVSGSEKLREVLKKLPLEFEAERPAASLSRLQDAMALLSALPDNPWKVGKLAELRRLLISCSGLVLEAVASKATVVPGESLAVSAVALNRSGVNATLKEIRNTTAVDAQVVNVKLERDLLTKTPLQLKTSETSAFTAPPWLQQPATDGRWTVEAFELRGLPKEPPTLTVSFLLELNGKPLTVERPVIFRNTDPVLGERVRPVAFVPAAIVKFSGQALPFASAEAKIIEVTVKATTAATAGVLRPETSGSFAVEPAELGFSLKAADEEQTLRFRVKPPSKLQADSTQNEGSLQFKIGANPAQLAVAQQLVQIDYPHLPPLIATQPVNVRLVRFDLAKSKKRIAYVPGAGDQVAEALLAAGYNVTLLPVSALERSTLTDFDVLLFGVRAFNVSPGLHALHGKLMKFVENGGTMVVQYNTNNRISAIDQPIGPYPFTISRDRVTEERAVVTPSRANHVLMTTPHALTPADFDQWVQERGLYFAGTWDSRYQTPFELHDTAEPAKQGALLMTKYGKGVFVYTGFAFFRQLPAGVPGAFRLFGNIVATQPGAL